MSLQISGFTYFQESPDVKFFLLIPPNTRLDPSSTLLDSDCVPSSLVRFIPENFQRGTDPDTGLKIFAKKWRRNFCPKQQNLHYNRDLISNPLKSVNIWNTSFLKIGFQIVQFSKDQAIAMVPTFQNPDIFVRISNDFWWNDCHLSEFQMVGLPNFEIRTICKPTSYRPFKIQTSRYFRSPWYIRGQSTDHLNSEFIWKLNFSKFGFRMVWYWNRTTTQLQLKLKSRPFKFRS